MANGIDPTNPTEATTLVEILHGYAADGFSDTWTIHEDATIFDGAKQVIDVASLRLRSLRRLEGASDPADELAVIALETADGRRGTVVIPYGAAATADEAAFFVRLNDQRGDGKVPPAMPTAK